MKKEGGYDVVFLPDARAFLRKSGKGQLELELREEFGKGMPEACEEPAPGEDLWRYCFRRDYVVSFYERGTVIQVRDIALKRPLPF